MSLVVVPVLLQNPCRSRLLNLSTFQCSQSSKARLSGESNPSNRARDAIGGDLDAPIREGGAFEHAGFNLHATVRIAAEDDRGRERLCRYGARPPFSLDRLRVLPGGRISYRIKTLAGGRAKHRPRALIQDQERLLLGPRTAPTGSATGRTSRARRR
ncbi:transposase [Labilithrix luteola]|uniref:transposase n=1 Tax=Labilithrix luteola TaxID=1391654 RepID=UPI0011BAC650